MNIGSIITALTCATSVLAAPGPPPEPDAMELHHLPQSQPPPPNTATLRPRQHELEDTILTALLAQIQYETVLINATLRRFREPLTPAKRVLATKLVNINFERITKYLVTADGYLRATEADEVLAREAAQGCGAHCVSQKMNAVVNEVGKASKTSLLKLGLVNLGKSIQPAFLALSGTVLTVNTIVGGALVAVSALVNGLFLAISAGIAYLGRLVSDSQREQAGGPLGPKTSELVKVLLTLLKLAAQHDTDE